MTEETEQERPTLEGEAALELWRQGRKAWNDWIDDKQGWNISFEDVDFSSERDSRGQLSFSGYRFGNNNVNFSGVRFGKGNVHFVNTIFGDGDVNFSNATFDQGNVNFSESIFGTGDINFYGVRFGRGEVFFHEVNFGKGKVNFTHTIFDIGNVDFSKTTFGDGRVNFSMANLGKGNLDFSRATFGDGNVTFFDTRFGDGNVTFFNAVFGKGDLVFNKAKFGKGNVRFISTTFGEGDVSFTDVTFEDGNVNFDDARIQNLYFDPTHLRISRIEAEGLLIKGRAIFSFPPTTTTLKSFNLHSASFEGPLTLKGDLDIIPDLRATRYSHQVDLSELKVKLPRTQRRLDWPPKLTKEAKVPHDGARLRRLKEIAETNKDHQAALRFSADEHRAKRWIETSWAGSVLDMAFSAFSNYGQNILRPFVALFVLVAASLGLYKILATATSAAGWTGLAKAFILSASNSLPFLPQSRDLRKTALETLYGTSTDPGLWVDALMITQGVLSFIFLFLIGLGLRNRFRL